MRLDRRRLFRIGPIQELGTGKLTDASSDLRYGKKPSRSAIPQTLHGFKLQWYYENLPGPHSKVRQREERMTGGAKRRLYTTTA